MVCGGLETKSSQLYVTIGRARVKSISVMNSSHSLYMTVKAFQRRKASIKRLLFFKRAAQPGVNLRALEMGDHPPFRQALSLSSVLAVAWVAGYIVYMGNGQ